MNRELRYCAARSTNRIDIEFLTAGLHERPGKLNQLLKERILFIEDGEYDCILLNYGLCGNGTLGVSHPKLQIVIHNAHDCIPIIIGDEIKHSIYRKARPGTFFYSCGWMDELLVPGCPDYLKKYSELYGRTISTKQNDAVERVLIENYTHLAYIYWNELGAELEKKGREYTRQCLDSLKGRFGLNLGYEEIVGTPGRIQNLVDGYWHSNDFITLEPGRRLGFNAPQGILCVE